MGIKKKGIGAIAGLVALAVMAVGAGPAGATEVTSTGQANVTLTQSVQAPGFVSANAYATEAIQCKKASAVIDVPEAGFNPEVGLFNNNINRPGVGSQSTGSGSVTMDLVNPPSFEECAVYEFVAGPPPSWQITSPEVSAKVTTSGNWTAAATQNDPTEEDPPHVAIAVPPNGASILVGGLCPITVSPEKASAVNGDYTNPTEVLPGSLAVDGQLDDSSPGGCGGPPPAQFEAQYTANNNFTIAY